MNLMLILLAACTSTGKSDTTADDTAPGDTGCVPISPAVDAGEVTLTWSTDDLPDGLTPWVFTGSAAENRDLWCAEGGVGSMELTYYFAGGDSGRVVDLSRFAGQTLHLWGGGELVWFADVAAGGADTWAVE